MPEQTQAAPPLEMWGIVEVMGHRKYAGRISEQVIAGAGLVRVDVPAVEVQRGLAMVKVATYSKLIGVGSVYMISPTTEAIARSAASELARWDSDPLPVSLPEYRQLAAASAANDDDDDVFG